MFYQYLGRVVAEMISPKRVPEEHVAKLLRFDT